MTPGRAGTSGALALPAEDPAQVLRQRARYLPEPGERQHLLLRRGDLLAELGRAGKRPAVVGCIGSAADPARGMMADLLDLGRAM